MNEQRVNAATMSNDFQSAVRKSPETRYLHRLHCVKLVSDGCEVADVGRWFDRPARTVERWVRQYAEEGGAGLVDKPRKGRPATISDDLIPAIEKVLGSPPSAVGINGSTWTGVLLQELLSSQFEADLSLRQSQRLLKRLQG